MSEEFDAQAEDAAGPAHASTEPSLRSRLARLPQQAEPLAPFPTQSAPAPPVLRQPPPVVEQRHIPSSDSRHPQGLPGARPRQTATNPAGSQRVSSATHEPELPLIEPPRRRWPWVLGFGVVAGVIVLLLPTLLAWNTFNQIERFEISNGLVDRETAAGDTILLIGTDSRDGISEDDENSGFILGGGTGGRRSDTIMMLRIDEDGARFVSLPRDLWLPIDGGGSQRINTAIANGPDALVRTIGNELNIDVTSVIQVDLAGFMEVVDAVGGVTIDIAHPAFDDASGLDLPVAGPVQLDRTQALAYVRSRRYTEIINGQEVRDPTSDLGRVQRQQVFMRALFEKMTQERNPATLNSMGNAVAAAITLDDTTSLRTLFDLANTLRTLEPESLELPTVPTTIEGNSVLLLGEGADEVLDRLRG